MSKLGLKRSWLLRTFCALFRVLGGGVILDRERLRASSWCDFLVWESARCGTAGASLDDPLDERVIPAVVAAREGVEKNSERWFGSGVLREDSTEEVSAEVIGVMRKLREICEKSDSSADRREEFEDDDEIERMSGAV